MTPHILVVEDEDALSTLLQYNLDKEGYDVVVASDGEEALTLVSEKLPDLVVLDWMLPKVSGIEVCRRLRQRSESRNVPIIMLTARGEELDRVIGLELGADDYVVKPFSVKELLLRVKAVLRRRADAPGPSRLGAHGIELDADRHEVKVHGEGVVLTALEFKLLRTFLERPGRIQSRETLLADVWGITAEVTTRTVDTHIKRLREKLGRGGDGIETVRGVGYMLAD